MTRWLRLLLFVIPLSAAFGWWWGQFQSQRQLKTKEQRTLHVLARAGLLSKAQDLKINSIDIELRTFKSLDEASQILLDTQAATQFDVLIATENDLVALSPALKAASSSHLDQVFDEIHPDFLNPNHLESRVQSPAIPIAWLAYGRIAQNQVKPWAWAEMPLGSKDPLMTAFDPCLNLLLLKSQGVDFQSWDDIETRQFHIQKATSVAPQFSFLETFNFAEASTSILSLEHFLQKGIPASGLEDFFSKDIIPLNTIYLSPLQQGEEKHSALLEFLEDLMHSSASAEKFQALGWASTLKEQSAPGSKTSKLIQLRELPIHKIRRLRCTSEEIRNFESIYLELNK